MSTEAIVSVCVRYLCLRLLRIKNRKVLMIKKASSTAAVFCLWPVLCSFAIIKKSANNFLSYSTGANCACVCVCVCLCMAKFSDQENPECCCWCWCATAERGGEVLPLFSTTAVLISIRHQYSPGEWTSAAAMAATRRIFSKQQQH